MHEAVRNIDGSHNPDVVLPGRIADAYYGPDGRAGGLTPNKWIGNLLTGKVDPSGLMYMRNRYYDPKTGRFTQEDPIGLAGGMNLYGFAGGDPVNFSDPFGLFEVRFADSGAKEAYERLRKLASSAASSNDPTVASGGRGLGGLLDGLERSSEVVTIGTFNANWFARNSAQDVGTIGGRIIMIDPAAASSRTGNSVSTLLAHELGHAYNWAVDGSTNARRSAQRSVSTENFARMAQGCALRQLPHDRIRSSPACNR
jgi:RHS repeat-associated protein